MIKTYNIFTIYQLPNRIVTDTKLQTLQYKILNNIIPCRAKLFHWKIADTDRCNYCGAHDSLSHFLYRCEVSKRFWRQLINWIENSFKLQIDLSIIDIIFGIKGTKGLLLNLNYFILYGKQFIYWHRIEQKDLFLLEFLNELKQNLIVEKFRHAMNDNLKEFSKNWTMFYPFFLKTLPKHQHYNLHHHHSSPVLYIKRK